MGFFYDSLSFMKKEEAIQILKDGGIGIFPTDTLYGVVGSALSKEAVDRIYGVKGRDENKPFIVLISAISDLKSFGISLTPEQVSYLDSVWLAEGRVNQATSVVLPCSSEEFLYIHRGTQSIAFRLPNHDNVLDFLRKTGPLVAPSANPQGLEPAYTIEEAQNYFGESVDFYVDEGEKRAKPSTIVSMLSGEPVILRK